MRAGPSPDAPGLQPERTRLAWGRTALGMLANAALLSVREIGAAGLTVAVVPATFAVLIALVTVVLGRRRAALLRRSPFPARVAPVLAVPVVGWSVVALAVVTGVVLL
ncbi:DUF202 domain-containing protein [Pseudonocardia alaniniphila]|uniref:DUF202 domain-containing protein n=1 Tax=Pseudonocardia alaniniphila TaxID=75291 RepID=A0ABS9TRZ0_9PSEU|nr:DUF202 domain-containing protein [Pseudonocardia alaniniphila]MCH6171178.1 DUF202 domain-containing protein [Pseudonocardia alaniniphila]